MSEWRIADDDPVLQDPRTVVYQQSLKLYLQSPPQGTEIDACLRALVNHQDRVLTAVRRWILHQIIAHARRGNKIHEFTMPDVRHLARCCDWRVPVRMEERLIVWHNIQPFLDFT